MIHSQLPQQPDFVLFADEFAQPKGSLRTSVRALWVELQDSWNAHRAATRLRRDIARGRTTGRHALNCSTLPQWKTR